MPELPEVETVMRGLRGAVQGLRIARVTLHAKSLRKALSPKLKSLVGSRIQEFTRRAKYIVMTLDDGRYVLAHLGMTGAFNYIPYEKSAFYVRAKHDHVVIDFEDGSRLVYHDPRRFGMIDLLPEGSLQAHSALCDLGCEPLERQFTGVALYTLLQGRRIAVKQAIMDQKIVVGVGNIYASEALYWARISPLRPACALTLEECGTLVKAIKDVLRAAIRAGGSTLRNYRHVGGESGNFQVRLAVYDHAGKACPDCTCQVARTGGIQKIVQGGRSSFYCPRLQG
ncbi:MAG: bifunctional DNA-formamidopyrimidine glycosylase/DNA-(apurinic or apyrimidinic site) lyase [Pseudobdellovibrionaceae bacterium]